MAFPELIEVIVGGFHAPAVLITITILLFFFCISLRSRASKLPPGPFALPIIGNLHQVGKFPHRSLQQLAMKYGPIMYLRFGSFPTIVVSSPEMAKEILTTHDLAFASRPASAVGKHLGDNYKDIAFVPYGAYWRHVRKICAIHLFNARVLESSASLRMEEVSTAMRSIWEKSRQGKVAINVSTVIESLNFSIIWRIIFGTKYSQNDLDCTDEGKEVRNMLQEATRTIVAVNIGDHIPYIDWLDLQGIKRRMKKVRSFFDRLMTQKILDERTQKSNEKNLVDALLEMAESDDHMNNHIKADNIKAILFDLINGGTATTSVALEWMMSEMVRNPHVAKKLQEEIESVVGKHRMVRESDLGSMEYLQCVVKESLRLYPSGPILVPHESIQSCTVGAQGFVIPHKTRLIVNAWAMGRDPTVWDDPLAFKPERFIDKDIDIKGQHFELLPFGAGRRGCPGALMAIRTMQLTLAQLMHCFDWTIEGDPSEIDMNEFPGTGLIRKENLFAIPALKVNCL